MLAKDVRMFVYWNAETASICSCSGGNKVIRNVYTHTSTAGQAVRERERGREGGGGERGRKEGGGERRERDGGGEREVYCVRTH